MYLLDDPLSALDAHVAEHVFNQCVLGAMKGKARILVTHQVGFLSSADHVVALRDGAIVASGESSGRLLVICGVPASVCRRRVLSPIRDLEKVC